MINERALITGASSGIGEALARELALKGIKLILSGRNQAKLEALAQELKAEEIIVAELQERQERQKIIACIRSKVPDLVINNAGFGIYGDVMSISVADQLSILEVNAAAALELTLESARALINAKKKGVICNVSSTAGEFPCPGMSVYGASKAFLTKVSQALNTELASKGVSILAACPGMVATDFSRRASKKVSLVSKGPVLTAPFVAAQILKQIEKKKEKVIFNWQYRFICWFAQHFISTEFIKKIIWKRIRERIQ